MAAVIVIGRFTGSRPHAATAEWRAERPVAVSGKIVSCAADG
jgi:hypothetical protein